MKEKVYKISYSRYDLMFGVSVTEGEITGKRDHLFICNFFYEIELTEKHFDSILGFENITIYTRDDSKIDVHRKYLLNLYKEDISRDLLKLEAEKEKFEEKIKEYKKIYQKIEEEVNGI